MPKVKALHSHAPKTPATKAILDPAIERAPIHWGYARVSREDQELALQIDALKAKGIDPAYILVDKLSGVKEDRPGFQSLIASLRPGDTLTVWKMDRLGRSSLSVMKLMDHLYKMGVAVIVLTLGMDTATPVGRMIVTVMSALAELEREQLIERTQAGLKAARARGKLTGRPPALTPAQKRQCVIMHRDEGKSVSEIAEIFNVARSIIGRYVVNMRRDTEEGETE